MNISIEIIARDEQHILDTLLQVREFCPSVNTINVPDIVRYPMRSWEAVRVANAHFGRGQNEHAPFERAPFKRVIPHLRAVDFDLEQPFPLIEALERDGIDEVLVVSGDVNKDSTRQSYPTTSIPLIRKLKQELPRLIVYAALDPYRDSLKSELRYAAEKIDAGADGLFTQPFFDLRLMDIYGDALRGVPVYWGVSPVLTDNSRRYWETVNQVVFPADFEPTIEANRQFAQAALDFARDHDQHIYYMPIKADIKAYLHGIL